MTIGERIKKIRIFRGITQKELGQVIGIIENRVSQYEHDYRIPKKALSLEIASALHAKPENFCINVPDSVEDIMRIFLWLEETWPNAIRLFPLVCNSTGEFKTIDEQSHNSKNWSAGIPVGMCFEYEFINQSMREWMIRQQEYRVGQITEEEYFEWKINWSFDL